MSRTFDLRVPAERRAYAEWYAERRPLREHTEGATAAGDTVIFYSNKKPQRKPLSSQDVIEGLQALTDYLRRPDWLVIPEKRYVLIPVGPRKSLRLEIPDTIALGLCLTRLSHLRGFNEFTKGFTNVTQFEDSWFEAQVADWCNSLVSVQSLEFAPAYNIKGVIKRPDFQLATNEGVLVCECKRSHQTEQKAQRQFSRRAQALHEALKEVGGLASTFRLEVQIYAPIRESFGSLAKQTAEAAVEVSKGGGGDFTMGPLHVSVCRRDSPMVKDKDANVAEYAYELGTQWTPVFEHPYVSESAVLCVTTDRLDKHITRAVGKRLREARDQLPSEHQCVVFLRVVSPRVAMEVCLRRLRSPYYSHLGMVHVWGDSEAGIAHRKQDYALIRRLFGEQLLPERSGSLTQ